MEKAKVHFSKEELNLMQNSSWILTKNRIIEKIEQGFQNLAFKFQEDLEHVFMVPPDVLQTGYKISKGEKYKGLPYLILDCPRLFGKEDIYALRTMFWWGNYFSMTLHVRGRFLWHIQQSVLQNIPGKKTNDLFVSYSGDEWNHDINEKNYLKLSDYTIDAFKVIRTDGFFKISKKFQLGDWEEIENNVYGGFKEIMAMVSA